jgi:hypothetical protein
VVWLDEAKDVRDLIVFISALPMATSTTSPSEDVDRVLCDVKVKLLIDVVGVQVKLVLTRVGVGAGVLAASFTAREVATVF